MAKLDLQACLVVSVGQRYDGGVEKWRWCRRVVAEVVLAAVLALAVLALWF